MNTKYNISSVCMCACDEFQKLVDFLIKMHMHSSNKGNERQTQYRRQFDFSTCTHKETQTRPPVYPLMYVLCFASRDWLTVSLSPKTYLCCICTYVCPSNCCYGCYQQVCNAWNSCKNTNFATFLFHLFFFYFSHIFIFASLAVVVLSSGLSAFIHITDGCRCLLLRCVSSTVCSSCSALHEYAWICFRHVVTKKYLTNAFSLYVFTCFFIRFLFLFLFFPFFSFFICHFFSNPTASAIATNAIAVVAVLFCLSLSLSLWHLIKCQKF